MTNRLISTTTRYEDVQRALRQARADLFAEFQFDPASRSIGVVPLRGLRWRLDAQSECVYVYHDGLRGEQCEGALVSPTRYRDPFSNYGYHVRLGSGGGYEERFLVLSSGLEMK